MALPQFQPYITEESPYALPLLSLEQRTRLNRLVGEAAFDERLEYRLVQLRDDKLSEQYQLSTPTWCHIKAIQASSLEEFCIAVSELQKTTVSR